MRAVLLQAMNGSPSSDRKMTAAEWLLYILELKFVQAARARIASVERIRFVSKTTRGD
jgi:hypothetical protein